MDIEYLPLSYGEELRLAASIGSPDQSAQWWHRACLFAGVRKVDDRRVHFPQHPDHIRKIAKRLGKAGAARVRELARDTVPDPDADGDDNREIEAVELDEIELLDFFERFGAVADIPAFAGIAILTCSVRKLDGQKMEMPANVAELSERVDALGRSGVEAAARAIQMAPEGDEEREAATAKN